ncbi:uncharacterized protein LOC141527723 [Cotesia typhae]|uniref:uncharacterized protein LOC141527723 n=1 Tax=Cotesia typhae TaxID=2053667 RepID=UPI003D69C698
MNCYYYINFLFLLESSNVKNKSPGLAITSKRKNKSSSSETESFNSSTEDPFMDTSKSDDTGGESTLGENDKTETEAENNSLADELGEKEKSAGEKEIGASAIEDNLGNKSKNKTDIEATQPEYYDENIQLLGPNHGEKMIEFVPNIFCIKKKIRYWSRQWGSDGLSTLFDGRDF